MDDEHQDTERPLRCLWLTKGLGRGGVERLLVDLYPLMESRQFAIDVAYVLPWKDHFHAELTDLGAEVHCLDGGGLRGSGWTRRLRALLSDHQPDIVHTHAPLPAIAARCLAGMTKRPAIVHTEHNMWDRYRAPTRLLNAATYHRNDEVIAVSDSVKRTIRPPRWLAQPHVSTILHGTKPSSIRSYAPDERRRRRSEFGLPQDGFVIGNVANFTPKKDHRTLLQAIASTGPIADARLVLIGSGPLEDSIRTTINELGLTDRVTMLGTRDDVFEILPLLDAFALSSRFEGFPISLVEAMATGVPCVATTAGGIAEIITNGENGLLVEPGQPRQLRAAIESLMSEPAIASRLAQQGRAAAAGLDLATAAERTQAIYLRALRQEVR